MKLSKNRLIKIRNTRNQTKKKYKRKKRKHNHKRPRRSFRKNRFNLAKNTVKRRHKQRGGGKLETNIEKLRLQISNFINSDKELEINDLEKIIGVGSQGNGPEQSKKDYIDVPIIYEYYNIYKRAREYHPLANQLTRKLFENSPYLAIKTTENAGLSSFVKGINDSIRILTRDEGGEGKAEHVVDYDEENINLLWSELSENYTKLDYGEIISRLLFISKFKSDDDPIKHLYNFVNGDNNFNKMYKIDEPKIMKKLNEIINEIVELPKNIRQKQEEAARAEAARAEEQKAKHAEEEEARRVQEENAREERDQERKAKEAALQSNIAELTGEGRPVISLDTMRNRYGAANRRNPSEFPQDINRLQLQSNAKKAEFEKKIDQAVKSAPSLNDIAIETGEENTGEGKTEEGNTGEGKTEEGNTGGAKKTTLAVNKGKLRILLKSFIEREPPLVLNLPIKISDNLYINISFELDKNGLTVVEKKDERKWKIFKKRFYFKERGKCKEISLNKIFKSFYKFKDKIARIQDQDVKIYNGRVYTDKKCTNLYINEEKQQPRPEKQPDIPSNKDIIYEMFTEYYNKLLRNYKQLVDYRNSGEDDTEKLANIILQIQNEIPSIEKNDDIKNIIMGFKQGGDLREEPNITNLIEPALSKLEEISEEFCKKFSRLTENKELERLGKIKRKFRNQCPADTLIGKVERFKELNNILEKSVIKESDKILRSADSGATEGGGKEPSKLLSLMNASEEELDNYKNVLGTAGPHPLPQPPDPEEKGNDEDTGDKKAKDKQRGDYVIIDKEAFETLWLQYRAPQKRDDIKIYGKKSWGKLANTVKKKLTSKKVGDAKAVVGAEIEGGEMSGGYNDEQEQLAKALRAWGEKVGELEITDIEDMSPKIIDKQMLYLIENIKIDDKGNVKNNQQLDKLYNCAPYVRTFFSDPELWKKRTKQLIGIFGLEYLKQLSIELIQGGGEKEIEAAAPPGAAAPAAAAAEGEEAEGEAKVEAKEGKRDEETKAEKMPLTKAQKMSSTNDLKLLMAIVRTYVKEDTLALGAIIIERYPEYHSIKKWLANKFKNKWGPMVATIIASTGLNVGASSLLVLATSLTAVGGTVAGLAYGIGHLTNKTYSSFKKHFGGSSTSQVLPKIKFTAETVCDEECQKSAEETQVMTQITKPIRDPSSGIIIGYSTDIAVTNDGITPRNMIIALRDKKKYFNNRDGGKEGKEGEDDEGNIRQGLLDVLRTAQVPPREREQFDEATRALGPGRWTEGPVVDPSVLEEGRRQVIDLYGRVVKDPANIGLRKVVIARVEGKDAMKPVTVGKGEMKSVGGGKKNKKKGHKPSATCGRTRGGQERKMIDCNPANLPDSLKCEWDPSKKKCIPKQPLRLPAKTPPSPPPTPPAKTPTPPAQSPSPQPPPSSPPQPPTQPQQKEKSLERESPIASTTPISETSDEILMDKNGNYYLLTLKDTTKKRTRKQSCAQYSNKDDHDKCCDISGCALSPSRIACITQSNLGEQDNKCPPESNSGKTTIANEAAAKKADNDAKKAAAKKAEEEANNAKAKEDDKKKYCMDASGNPVSKLQCFKNITTAKETGEAKQEGGKRTRRKKRHRKKRISRTTRKR